MMMRSFNFVPLVVIFLASARIEIVARGFTRAGDDSFDAFVLSFRGEMRGFFSFFFLFLRSARVQVVSLTFL